MVDVNPRLKQIIFNKIDEDLADVIFHPYGKEVWLVTMDDKTWYFVGDSEGTVWFNQKFFNNFFNLFSMGSKEYSPFLKEWFEIKTKITIRKIARRNTNYDYMLDGIVRRSDIKYDWTIKNRWGFSYPTVKKYLDLKESLESEEIKIRDIVWSS
jgi:hypothetical protein